MIEAISIRPAKPHENRQLGELAFRSKGYWGYTPEFMEACRAELSVSRSDISNPKRRYFVAEVDAKIVGFYALERIASTEYELEALFVEPEHIGRGVGRRLIEHAKLLARGCGATSILIQGDPNVSYFYEAAGATRIGERESASIPGRFLPEYRLKLLDHNDA
jgi:N-acetylglutamate synthase-like GNAT family acetyltransferase